MISIAGWNDDRAHFTAEQPVVPTPPPVPGQLIGPFTAVGAIRQGYPVSTASGNNRVSETPQTEAGVTAYQGIAATAAADGAQVYAYYQGPCPLFSGLNTAPTAPDMAEYFVYGPFPPVLASAIPVDSWYRSVGTPLNTTTLTLTRGSISKKGDTLMAGPLRRNNSGHMEPDTQQVAPRSYEAGEAGAAYRAWYIKEADGKAYLVDGTEEAADNFEGINVASVLMGAQVELYPPGMHINSSGLSLTPGEVWAKHDGTLVPFSGLGADKWTLVVADADGANSFDVAKRGVQKTEP